MRPSATATGLFAVLAVTTAMVTFTAIAESRRRGHWCSSPRFVVTTYAAINILNASAEVSITTRLGVQVATISVSFRAGIFPSLTIVPSG
jgi:hypothetical protein